MEGPAIVVLPEYIFLIDFYFPSIVILKLVFIFQWITHNQKGKILSSYHWSKFSLKIHKEKLVLLTAMK